MSGSFGAVPSIYGHNAGSSAVALIIAVPLSVGCGVCHQTRPQRLRAIISFLWKLLWRFQCEVYET